jgi:hypothetical protein
MFPLPAIRAIRMKRRFALAALLLAAAPLHAQGARTHRFDGGTFSIELPAGLPALQLMRDTGTTIRFQLFGGRHADGSMVLVVRAQPTPTWAGVEADTAERRRSAMRLTNDSALIARYVESGTADPNEVRSALADTTLYSRRYLLREFRATLRALTQPAWIELGGDAQEIVGDERVTLRSPVTLRLKGLPPLHGTADVLISRRGAMVLWMVARAAPRRTPAFEAATERMLGSFRITERP